MNHINTLKTQARTLRLSTLATNLELRLQEATSHQLPHAQFLELLLQDELNGRQTKAIARDTKAAAFRETRSLSDFDFSFNPGIPRSLIYELANCQFIEQARDVLLIGPPGVGKSHIAQAIGREAIRHGHKVYYRSIFELVRDLNATGPEPSSQQDQVLNRYLKPQLLIIDDMGMKALPKHGAELLLEIIVRRNGLHSTLMTTNRPIDTWGELLGDLPSAGAILDRLLHHAEIITIEGRSHRLAQRAGQTTASPRSLTPQPRRPEAQLDSKISAPGPGELPTVSGVSDEQMGPFSPPEPMDNSPLL